MLAGLHIADGSRRPRAQRAIGRSLNEEMIHRATAEHLARRAKPGVVFWHCPNGEARGAGIGGKLKALGTRAGMPDLMALSEGQLYALELKRQGGRLSDTQRRTLSDLEAAGCCTAVAYGLDAALAQIEAWGLIR